MIISPHGTAANETFSLTNTSGTDKGAIAITATAGGISATVADEKDLTLGNAALDAYFKVAASGTAGNEDVRIVNTNGTDEAAIALTSTAGGVDVDAAAAKDVNISGGQVALVSKDNAASAISLTANVGTSETIVITNTQGTSSSAVDINAIAGGVTVDAGSGVSIDAGAASNLTTSAGALTIDGAAGVNLAGNSSEIDVTTSGTVDINSATLDIDASTTLSIDNSNTTNGITIGTATSGVPVSIGHTTSEVTVNDNLTVTGNVIFQKGKQYFEASKLSYDLRKDTGYIDNVYGLLKSNTFSKAFKQPLNSLLRRPSKKDRIPLKKGLTNKKGLKIRIGMPLKQALRKALKTP